MHVLDLLFHTSKIEYFIKTPKNVNIQKYLREYKDVFSSDRDILFCKECAVKVNVEIKF